MAHKELSTSEARKALSWASTRGQRVKVTLGPRGRYVVLDKKSAPRRLRTTA